MGPTSDYSGNFDRLNIVKMDGTNADIICGNVQATGIGITGTNYGINALGDFAAKTVYADSNAQNLFCTGANQNQVILRRDANYLYLCPWGTDTTYSTISIGGGSACDLNVNGNITNSGQVTTQGNITINKSNPVINFYNSATFLGDIGHDNSNFYVTARTGNLYLFTNSYVEINGNFSINKTNPVIDFYNSTTLLGNIGSDTHRLRYRCTAT
jgi:hypothetical protein